MGWPSQFQSLWPIDAQGNYVVQNDDRLVVLTQAPSTTLGQPPQNIILFDGFAQIPQVDVSAQRQEVTFVAQSVAIRLWDQPITGRVHAMRHTRRRPTDRPTYRSISRVGSIPAIPRSALRAATSATASRRRRTPRLRIATTLIRCSSTRWSSSDPTTISTRHSGSSAMRCRI